MALIFLLIMTLLGVFGMNQSRLENLMAGNNQFQTLALNHAELMLDAAIQSLQGSIGPPYTDSDETAGLPGTGGDSAAIAGSATTAPRIVRNDSTPPPGARPGYSYHSRVEHLGTLDGRDGGDCSAATGTGSAPDDCQHEVYRVTGESHTSRGARRTIQSIFTAADLM